MNTQEMKKLHKKNPDKWIIVRGGNLFGWEKRNRFPDPEIFSEEEIKTLGYKIIDIKDEIIVDAVIANPDVEVEIYIGNKWFDLEDFFEVYDSNNKYLLKEYRKQMNDDMLKFIDKNKQDFNGGYIKASQEAYDLLVETGYTDTTDDDWKNDEYFEVSENIIYCGDITNSIRQFYINNGTLSWGEPKGQTYTTENAVDMNTYQDHPLNMSVPIHINNMEDLNELPIYEAVSFGECEECANYLDALFENPNCNGCSKNPFYINCFTPIKGQ